MTQRSLNSISRLFQDGTCEIRIALVKAQLDISAIFFFARAQMA